jgi:hypothetical protein
MLVVNRQLVVVALKACPFLYKRAGFYILIAFSRITAEEI